MIHPAMLGLAALCLLTGLFGCATGPQKASEVLAPYKGDVLVLLMGQDGCGGTRNLSGNLAEYNKVKPQGVSVVRIDAPPPGGKISPAGNWTAGYPYSLDDDRVVADHLGFFYYPTLYILDQDGEVRYSGGGEGDIKTIVSEILSEKPGSPKKMFSPMMLAVGDRAAPFTTESLAGQRVSNASYEGKDAVLIIFSSTTCPYSMKAVKCAPKLKTEFAEKGADVLVVDFGGDPDSIRSFYEESTPGITVIPDEDQKISREGYGVQAVPFFYVLNKDGRVAYRMPFSEDAARDAMKVTLGLMEKPGKIEARGAG
jgi:peroxiredoxin